MQYTAAQKHILGMQVMQAPPNAAGTGGHKPSPLSVSSLKPAKQNYQVPPVSPSPGSFTKSKFAVFGLVDEEPPKTFHEAAEKGNTNMLVRMIERTIDFDINQRDKLNRTALHWAAEMGHRDAAQLLIDYGIDRKLTECNGRTAVHLAARNADADMLKLLIHKLPEKQRLDVVNQPDAFQITPVYLALQKGEEGKEAFEFLMTSGARYNEQLVLSSAAAVEVTAEPHATEAA